ELTHELPGPLHVQHRQRRAAVRADRAAGQFDRRAAVRAVDRLDVLAQILQLLGREWLDEVLFLQEVEERDEPPMSLVAPPILEPRIPLHVVSQRQPRGAPGTAEDVAQSGLARRRVLADQFEELKRRTRTELKIFR